MRLWVWLNQNLNNTNSMVSEFWVDYLFAVEGKEISKFRGESIGFLKRYPKIQS